MTAVFQFGEFTFDCRSRVLLRDGQERHLTPKAQQLLHLLLQERPRVLSREELYDALWPETFVSETNLATVVNEVRRTLGDDARVSHYIRTVHGFGYAFCGEVVSSARTGSSIAMLICEGRNHLLYEGENSVGRAVDSRVVLTSPTISRHHAVMKLDGGSVWITDV
ncbi:MAG: winged helix-turn-helix domain-containing protein, partial [Thermoanaerobaculia bacterium]